MNCKKDAHASTLPMIVLLAQWSYRQFWIPCRESAYVVGTVNHELIPALPSCHFAFLSLQGGPYVAGKEFTAVDAKLAPALYHLQTALAHYKNWSIPPEYKHVLEYIKVRIGAQSRTFLLRFQTTKLNFSMVQALDGVPFVAWSCKHLTRSWLCVWSCLVQAVESRESFKKTAAPKDVLIAGWNRALGVTA